MKLCKIKIEKICTGNRCQNIYPSDYNPEKMNVICYDEKKLNPGLNFGYCIASVANEFEFTDAMAEITREEAEAFVNERVIDSIPDEASGAKFANTRKGIIANEISK